ncbi:MAG: hypothetical protein ABFD97_06745 [Syntrophobacter sp.]
MSVLQSKSGPDTGVEDAQSRRRDLFIRICLLLPVLSLGCNLIFWLRCGIDLPVEDDWRSFIFRGAGSFRLDYLFKPSNDTIFPVGLALDSIAQCLFNGNAIVYQFLSMLIVIGLLLFLQWRLLVISVRDRFLAASAFGLTLLMLQPGSYWGYQSLAYHHAIPLLCGLGAIHIVLATQWRPWKSALLFALGTVSGLSYISGAFSILAIGLALFLLGHYIDPSERVPLVQGGLSLAIAGFLTAIPQTWVIVFMQRGMYLPGTAMAYPYQADFWLFLLGIVSRSLLLPKAFPLFSFIVTVCAVLACMALAFRFMQRLSSGEPKKLEEARTAIVFVTLLAGVFVYLMLVAAGRTNVNMPEAKTALAFFTHGRGRFHFFWVTLVWPWLAASAFYALRTDSSRIRVPSLYSTVVTLLLVPMLVYSFKPSDFLRTMRIRAAGIQCINSELQKDQKRVYCPQVYPEDIYGAIAYARSINASFLNSIHFVPVPLGTNEPPPLYRLSQAGPAGPELRNAVASQRRRGGYKIKGGANPQVLIKTGTPEEMEQCLVLEVSALLRATVPDAAQLFYKAPGAADFKPLMPDWPIHPDKGLHLVSFEVCSEWGFADELRLDPVKMPQQFDLLETEVRCRMTRP